MPTPPDGCWRPAPGRFGPAWIGDPVSAWTGETGSAGSRPLRGRRPALRDRDSNADELRLLDVSRLVEGVGVDEPEVIVLGALKDRVE